jgi:iron complex outermembrane recepter protein
MYGRRVQQSFGVSQQSPGDGHIRLSTRHHNATQPTRLLRAAIVLGIACSAPVLGAPSPASMATLSELRSLSLEELMNVEVVSVSRRPERLAEAASAIQIITAEDIRRSGATSLPEALRLAPNLQVAQVNGSQWAISARGFNNVLANKLLVLIDGRVVYTPLFAGVFWDVQDALLADIERIEVISGPGGTLWGSNAVNGVINILTKNARATPGLFSEVGGGSELRELVGLRYGGELTPELHYRIYGKAIRRDSTELTNGADAQDSWNSSQGGVRLDWQRSRDSVTVQGDFYRAKPNPDGLQNVAVTGGNLLTRWGHTFSERTDFVLTTYFDRTRRDLRNGFRQDLDTFDVDWQQRFQASARQQLVWGLEVRRMDHAITNLPLFQIRPPNEVQYQYSAFINDAITLVPQRLQLTVGAKLEDTHYTGVEYQPSIRLAWTPTERQTVWGAISRAVRTPSRIDRDFFLNLTPEIPLIATTDFDSEELLAYEAGWRAQPSARFSFSVAGFFNEYDKLRTAEPGPGPLNLPITFRNGVAGDSYGLELTANYQLLPNWRVRAGYTYFRKDLEVKPTSRDLNDGSVESNDPEHQALLQSTLDLGRRIELDWVARYVDRLPDPHVAAYLSLDLRLGWRVSEGIALSLVGQNLLDDRHPEFVPASPSPRDIERSFYARLTWDL